MNRIARKQKTLSAKPAQQGSATSAPWHGAKERRQYDDRSYRRAGGTNGKRGRARRVLSIRQGSTGAEIPVFVPTSRAAHLAAMDRVAAQKAVDKARRKLEAARRSKRGGDA